MCPSAFSTRASWNQASEKRGRNGGCALCIIQPFPYATGFCFTLAQEHQGDGILRFQLGCLLEVRERRVKVLLCDLKIPEHEMSDREVRLQIDRFAQRKRGLAELFKIGRYRPIHEMRARTLRITH